MSSDTTSREDTYTHRPDGQRVGTADAGVGPDDPAVGSDEPEPKGFGRRGWVLVGAVALCFLVVPGAVYLVPSLPAMAGLPYVTAMLALPMVPALVLGAVAVWSMTAATRGDD